MRSLFDKTFKIFLLLFIILLVGVAVVESILINSDLMGHENIVKIITKYFHF